ITVKSFNKDTVTAAGEDGDKRPKEEPWETALKTTVVDIEVGEFRGHKVSLWDLLFSHYIPEEKRQELLELFRGGTLSIQELLSTTSSLASDSHE
ncbi:EPIPL protein, partial [Menura novaehollandiae]|nr:EPIPL protein [Menura novaehollandiae]